MSHPAVSYEDAKAAIGILPSLAPRPSSTSIRALTTDLVDKLTTIPSEQSADWGFSGLIEQNALYALKTGGTAWLDWVNPGPHRQIGGTAEEQRDAETRWEANKKVFDSEANVRRAINAALNIAVPKQYRGSAGTIGARVYKPNECPKTILNNLRARYGVTTPAETEANDAQWRAGWNPADPIEALFLRLEDCFTFAIASPPPYTEAQMVGKALDAIKKTGLYETAVVEWQGFDDANKTWPELKAHFGEAYEIRLASGAGTSRTGGYVNNATDNDDDSLGSIIQSFHSMQMANNANNQVTNDNISQITAETTALRQALVDTQQQLAMLARTQAQPVQPMAWPHIQPVMPTQPAPAPAAYNAYVPPPATVAVPQYQPPRGRNRKKRGNNPRNNQYPGQATAPTPYAPAPTAGGTIPPFNGGGSANNNNKPAFSNMVKHYNNWNMCYSCGWDVPSWHTSATCNNPNKRRGHTALCDRTNAEEYIKQSYPVCRIAMHKKQLPTNPGPEQA